MQEVIKKESKYRNDLVEVKACEVSKNIKARILRTPDGEDFVDIRNFYRGNPTKTGVRMREEAFKSIAKTLF